MSTKTKKSSRSKAATATAGDRKAASKTEEGASRQGDVIPTCPSCGAPMVLRTGKFGPFYGCSRYKSGECRATVPVQQ